MLSPPLPVPAGSHCIFNGQVDVTILSTEHAKVMRQVSEDVSVSGLWAPCEAGTKLMTAHLLGRQPES